MAALAAVAGPVVFLILANQELHYLIKGTKVSITFADVAGLDEAKVEVMEIVDF